MLNRLALLMVGLLLLGVGVVMADDAPAAPATTEPTTQSATIPASDTAALTAKKGETVTVEGVVESAKWAGSGKVLNVTFKDAEKDKGLLCCAFAKSKENLDTAFSGDAAKAWTGAKVQITGKLIPYGGKIKDWADRLQIIIQNPEQVKIVEPAAAK